MRILNAIKRILFGTSPVAEATEAQILEARRVRRRLEKFPRLRGCPNPYAHRNAHFKARFGLSD